MQESILTELPMTIKYKLEKWFFQNSKTHSKIQTAVLLFMTAVFLCHFLWWLVSCLPNLIVNELDGVQRWKKIVSKKLPGITSG